MVILPSGFPATGISGSRNTRASVNTVSSSLSANAGPGATPSMTAPAPISPSISRRVRPGLCRAASINLVISGLTSGPKQRQIAHQHIERHRANDSGKYAIERAASLRQMPRRAGTDQSADNAAGDEQAGQPPRDQAGPGVTGGGGQ